MKDMINQFSRTQLVLGADALKKLSRSRVAVFGLGGVGSYAVEALARSGVGTLDIIDNDTVSITNINRQLYALHSTVGKLKADVAEQRILDINPQCRVNKYTTFYMPDTSHIFDFSQYDFIIDAIDTVTGKIEIILNAQKSATPMISCMGTGNKTDPTALEVADIYNTSVCPLARVMRQELKKRGVKKLKVLYSKETPVSSGEDTGERSESRRSIPGSLPFVPSVAGLIIAGEAVKSLIRNA